MATSFSRDTTGEFSWQPVERVFVTDDRPVLDLALTWPDGSETLQVTAEHPVWVEDEGWVEAGYLRGGDHIATADAGGWATVQSLRGPPGKETVYNFVVANTHTFFVGTGATWVHNGGPCGGKVADVRVVGEPTNGTSRTWELRGRQGRLEFSSSKIRRLKKDIENNGYDSSKPIDIAITPEGRKIILDGHHRARAAGAAGMEEVPVRIWQVEQQEAIRILLEAAEAAENLGLRW